MNKDGLSFYPVNQLENNVSVRGSLMEILWSRFNLSFEANGDDSDSDAESDTVKPRFSSIKKASGFLDKELSASGFSRKEQNDIEKVCFVKHF